MHHDVVYGVEPAAVVVAQDRFGLVGCVRGHVDQTAGIGGCALRAEEDAVSVIHPAVCHGDIDMHLMAFILVAYFSETGNYDGLLPVYQVLIAGDVHLAGRWNVDARFVGEGIGGVGEHDFEGGVWA